MKWLKWNNLHVVATWAILNGQQVTPNQKSNT